MTIGAVAARRGGSSELETVRDDRRAELVERRLARARALREEKVLLPELRLDRRQVGRLQQLRDEQLADASDLVARLRRIGVGEQPVAREVGRIVAERVPGVEQRELTRADLGVDPSETRAARRDVVIE